MGMFTKKSNISDLRIAQRGKPGLRKFWSDETGSLVIFALMLALLMMMMGGIAVDVMRYESRRTSLQNTLDRSTLAAAAMNQTQDPEAVVNDYFLKAGLADFLTSVTVTQSLTSRTVSARALADTQPLFLHMMGITDFQAPGISTAEQQVGNVEIMLVLDVSGSMGGTKIANLKTAASGFVDTVMTGDDAHHISIGIVPYNAQVNLGATFRSKFSAVNQHGVANVNCLELPDSVFTSTTMPRNLDLPMMAYADVSSSTSKTDAYVATTNSNATPNYSSVSCKQNTNNAVMLPSDNMTALKNHINGLSANGNTSIVLGLKWGEAMLDPDLRDTYTSLIASGDIPATLPDRPFDYDADVLKIIVLMTDGEHVAHEKVADAYKTGPSPIYRYSIRHTSGRPALAGTNEYWVPHLAATSVTAAAGWQATPWDSGAGVTQQNWENIWASFRYDYVAWQFYARALGGTSSTLRNSTFTSISNTMTGIWRTAPQMDTLLQQACTAARDQNVIIYGIAFQASTAGQTQIRNCSTDGVAGSHYFNATTLNIASAFQTIASNISQLRLTQ
jgi:Flp pilus assembly protein TadG